MRVMRAGRWVPSCRIPEAIVCATVLLVVPAVAATGSFTAMPSVADSRVEGLPSFQDAVRVGSDVPEVALKSIDGQAMRLADLEGRKNVVLVFFRGTW